MKEKRTRLYGDLLTRPSLKTYRLPLLLLLLVALPALFLQYYNGVPTSKLRRTQRPPLTNCSAFSLQRRYNNNNNNTNYFEEASTGSMSPTSKLRRTQEPPLTNCSAFSLQRRYNNNNNTNYFEEASTGSLSPTCPDYFRWIHEDLKPWARSGITKKLVNRAKRTATFKLVIVNGRVYVEKYKKAIQTRDVYTLWGILQLLRRYPGKIPDLELMFDCADRPVINAAKYSNPSSAAPPPLFRYCADDKTLDIVFPDWSFWGWPEINIKPWEAVINDIKQWNKKSNWLDREPYAYWKGNPYVDKTRQDLLKCNVSDQQDWNARLFSQDWIRESEQGYKSSDLGSQCTHRYKIYIEGYAWSVSEKYILTCDSPTLIVTPKFYHFFTRALVPQHHYWPVKENDKCRSIKFAVEWGNSNEQKAQDIGKAASKFMQEDVKMEYVYDYMFQLLNQYSKLLRFKPKVPRQSVELFVGGTICRIDGFSSRWNREKVYDGIFGEDYSRDKSMHYASSL